MLPTKEVSRLTQRRFQAWESGELDQVLALYTDDAVLWNTSVPGKVQGRAELASYFGQFLARFDMRFAILEEHRLEDQDAAIVLWQATIRRRRADGRPGERVLMQRGMDLCVMRDELICRDESYMDFAALAALPSE